MTGSFYIDHPHILPSMYRFVVLEAHVSLVYAAFRIFEPLKRLNATLMEYSSHSTGQVCLNKASIAFMIISGTLARFELLRKWLNRKYRLTTDHVSTSLFLLTQIYVFQII